MATPAEPGTLTAILKFTPKASPVAGERQVATSVSQLGFAIGFH
jgi:hypothetical protein